MAQNETVWGVDIGQCALKALKLRNIEGDLRVEAFDVIDHPKILSQPDANREQLTRNALEQFLARNNVAGSVVAVAVPGQTGFTRFVKLPPVEPKQVPEIVRFEAEQQIPFDINEVIWRWQTFLDPDSPDIEVGIFAMKRPDVAAVLDAFSFVDINVDLVQMAPLALYNFIDFDGQAAGEGGATLLVDVGADKTDLVISDGPRIWTRTLQLGGNNFTEALVKVFKLSFSKAEKLKRTAATSKYARQIFQAMRPVFAELVQEIQRSIGYYTSLHRESHFRRVIGLGNGFRLPGLQKFLEQNLNIPVVRIDSYNKISPSATVNAPAFTENVLSFAVAYGLALQGLGLTKIKTNLLPSEIARQRLWARKRGWFAAAAAALVLGFAALAYSSYRHQQALDPARSVALGPVERVIKTHRARRGKFAAVKGRAEVEVKKIVQYDDMCAYRYFWPTLYQAVDNAIMNVADHQKFLTPEGLSALKKISRPDRRIVYVEAIYHQYELDIASASMDRRTGMGSGGRIVPRSLGRPEITGMTDMTAAARRQPGVTAARAPAAKAPAARAKAKRGYILFLEGTTPLLRRDVTDFLYQIVNRFETEAESLTYSEWQDVVTRAVVSVGRTMQRGVRWDTYEVRTYFPAGRVAIIIRADGKADRTVNTGPLRGGVAVLVEDGAAYWVQHGKVYAANGMAGTWSPEIDFSPRGIDEKSVKGAVGDSASPSPKLFTVLDGTVDFPAARESKTAGTEPMVGRREQILAVDRDPWTGDDMSNDIKFVLKWKVAINEDSAPSGASAPPAARARGVR